MPNNIEETGHDRSTYRKSGRQVKWKKQLFGLQALLTVELSNFCQTGANQTWFCTQLLHKATQSQKE